MLFFTNSRILKLQCLNFCWSCTGIFQNYEICNVHYLSFSASSRFFLLFLQQKHKMAFCSTLKQAKYADYKTSSEKKTTFETLNLFHRKYQLLLRGSLIQPLCQNLFHFFFQNSASASFKPTIQFSHNTGVSQKLIEKAKI